MSLDKMKNDYDWQEAMKFADKPYKVANFISNEKIDSVGWKDIKNVVAMDPGENDGPEWLAVFELHNGNFLFLQAGCDYTGWDCQSGGDSWVASDLDSLEQFGLTDDARSRLRKQLEAYKISLKGQHENAR